MSKSKIKKRLPELKPKKEIKAEKTSVSPAIAKPTVIRSTKRHAELIIKKLIIRPHLEDSDGYYDMIADEIQMIDIVEKYLSKYYV